MPPTRRTPMPSHDAAAPGQAPECQFCPLCQAMAALRSARPEAVEHLLKAGAELLLAAQALVAASGSPSEPHRPARGMQRIDVA
jgi:hypothetical protein